MADAENCEFRVGQRVTTSNTEKAARHGGVVKYVGPVEGHEGTWVGVDWDDGRGRHNGTVNGVQYFETTGEISGSLVRSRNLSAGVSLLDALSFRYKTAAPDAAEDDMYVMSVRQLKVAVEFVGKAEVEERQKNLQALQIATLNYAGVSSAGPPGELRAACSNINELHLIGNLLSDWQEVGRICEELPALQILDLSSSRISFPSNCPLPMLSNLTTLILNNCCLNWKQVELLKGSLPNIQELSLCANNLQKIEVGPVNIVPEEAFVEGFDSLRLLNLEENQFEHWEEILKLSKLKSLEQLYLSGNKLQHISYPTPPGGDDNSHLSQDEKRDLMPFASLRSLLLGRNQISDWAAIEALDQFPSLQELRLSDNPITDATHGSAVRYMIVARIGKLTSLNGSQVKPRERRDSEIRYVRHLLTSMQTNSIEDISKCHRRFEQLRALHDIPLDLQRGSSERNTQKLSSSLLSVNIVCTAASVGEKAPVSKKLPSATTVGRLKVLCEALFKLKADRQHLFYYEQDSPLPVSLDDDMETLVDIGLIPGATILVDER